MTPLRCKPDAWHQSSHETCSITQAWSATMARACHDAIVSIGVGRSPGPRLHMPHPQPRGRTGRVVPASLLDCVSPTAGAPVWMGGGSAGALPPTARLHPELLQDLGFAKRIFTALQTSANKANWQKSRCAPTCIAQNSDLAKLAKLALCSYRAPQGRARVYQVVKPVYGMAQAGPRHRSQMPASSAVSVPSPPPPAKETSW